MKRIIKCTSLLICVMILSQVFALSTNAATRVYWYKKMTDGGCIFYWVNSNVSYTSTINAAEVEIELPAAGYSNRMKMSKTTTQSAAKIDFHQVSLANSNTTARTYSYRAGESVAMAATDKDVYDWYWCKIELNSNGMYSSTNKQKLTIVHEMLHAFGGKDTYEDDQKYSIMYGWADERTATGVTADANAFLNSKY